MPMPFRHPEPSDRVPLEIELDQDNRLAADDPAVMAGLDCDDLRRFVLDHATVGIFDVDFSADEESDMRVHAEVGSDGRLHVDRPAKSRRIHHALDASLARAADLEAYVTDLAELCALDARKRHLRGRSWSRSPAATGGGFPRGALSNRHTLRRFLLCHVTSRLDAAPMLTRSGASPLVPNPMVIGAEPFPVVTAPALLAAVAMRRGQPQGPTTDPEIEDFIYDALELLPGASDIEVRCEGGRATLTGSVQHKRLKHDVGEIAWALPILHDVQNNLVIASRRRSRGSAREVESATNVANRKQS